MSSCPAEPDFKNMIALNQFEAFLNVKSSRIALIIAFQFLSLLCYLVISEPIIRSTSGSLGLQSRPADHDLFYGMDPTQNFRTKALAMSCNIATSPF